MPHASSSTSRVPGAAGARARAAPGPRSRPDRTSPPGFSAMCIAPCVGVHEAVADARALVVAADRLRRVARGPPGARGRRSRRGGASAGRARRAAPAGARCTATGPDGACRARRARRRRARGRRSTPSAGHVAAHVTSPTKPWRTPSSTCVTGLTSAIAPSQSGQQLARRVGRREEHEDERAHLHERRRLLGAKAQRDERRVARHRGGEAHDEHRGKPRARQPRPVDAERERDERAGTSRAAARAGTPTRRRPRAAPAAASARAACDRTSRARCRARG